MASSSTRAKAPTNIRPDAALMKCVWLLNAATVSFVEAKQLLEQIAMVLPETVALLDQESLPSDRKELFSSELTRFYNECTDLMKVLVQARGDKSGSNNN